MKISIIIPVYNEAKTICSCLSQFNDNSELEIIVVDGGSTDETVNIASSYKRVSLFCSPVKGRGQQLNHGAKKAIGDWLVFLHADTILPVAWQSEIHKAIALNKSAGCFKIDCGRNEALSWLDRIFAKLTNIHSYVSKYPYGDQAMFFQKEIFKNLGGFKNTPLMEDYDLSKRYYSKFGEFYHSSLKAIPSFRRFKGRVVRTAIIMRLFPILFNLGVKPELLARFYQAIR